jgi:hypothetical protein
MSELYDNPARFLKCPNCHKRAVKMAIHLDGDVSFSCDWCDATAVAHKLHESDTIYR